jgi:hypothetical protein
MLFMVIEWFRNHDSKPIYRRLRDEWRQMPAGLTDIDSWIEPTFERCFRLLGQTVRFCSTHFLDLAQLLRTERPNHAESTGNLK